MGENTFATPGREVHLKYQFRNSGARNCGITDLVNRQNGDQKTVDFPVHFFFKQSFPKVINLNKNKNNAILLKKKKKKKTYSL